VIEKAQGKGGLTPLDQLELFNRFRTSRLQAPKCGRELAEEGNGFEADAIYGVENARDPDVAAVTTRFLNTMYRTNTWTTTSI